MATNSQDAWCSMMHMCLPEGLRNGASHQIVLKSEGGDVWHDAQLRWNGPNQLQPGYTVTNITQHTVRHHTAQKKKQIERKDYASRCQFNKKSSIIPGCPGRQHAVRHHTALTALHLSLGAL